MEPANLFGAFGDQFEDLYAGGRAIPDGPCETDLAISVSGRMAPVVCRLTAIT
jgi:hypothetical protein